MSFPSSVTADWEGKWLHILGVKNGSTNILYVCPEGSSEYATLSTPRTTDRVYAVDNQFVINGAGTVFSGKGDFSLGTVRMYNDDVSSNRDAMRAECEARLTAVPTPIFYVDFSRADARDTVAGIEGSVYNESGLTYHYDDTLKRCVAQFTDTGIQYTLSEETLNKLYDGSFTLEVYVKMQDYSSASTWNHIAGTYYAGNDTGFAVGYGKTGNIGNNTKKFSTVSGRGGTDPKEKAYFANQSSADGWNHIVYVYDKNQKIFGSNNENESVYVNGTQIVFKTGTTPSIPSDFTTGFRIGADSQAEDGTVLYPANMDCAFVRVYNETLSATDAKLLCANATSSKTSTEDTPNAEELLKINDYTNGAYPKATNKLFGGWFTDKTFATAAISYATKGTAYAKFVNAGVLTVKGQLSADTTDGSETTNLRILSSVDSLDYAFTGFEITVDGKKTAVIDTSKVYEKVKATNAAGEVIEEYLPDVIDSQSSYFVATTIKNIPSSAFGTSITVRPYWTIYGLTQSTGGGRIYGTARTLTVNELLANMQG